jgi:site-specific DNA recombinase
LLWKGGSVSRGQVGQFAVEYATGANTDRPGLQRLFADVKAGLLDMVVTYKIDRLTRSPRDFYQLIELFEAHNVGFISVTERFDTSTPSGRLLRNIMLTFAQFERELISERVRDKVIQRVKRGLHAGGCPAFGYKTENGMLAIDSPRDEHVRLVFERYVKTRSIRAVLRALKEKGIVSRKGNPFCDSAIWNMLRNHVYAGKIVHKEKIHPGRHPAIISEDLFAHVQRLVAEAPRLPPNPENHLPFAGIIHCKECGSIMSVSFTYKKNKTCRRKYFYYRCNSVGHHGKTACSTRQIGTDRLHDMVYRNLFRISLDTEYLKNLVFSLQNQTRPGPKEGFEPTQDCYKITPENLQKSLTAYVKACARKTGIEKALAVRRGLRSIHYSKKSIRVDFVVETPELESDRGQTSGREGDSARAIDGKSPMEWNSSTSALRAADGGNSPGSDVGCRRGTPSRMGMEAFNQERERPNDREPLSLSTPVGGFSNGGGGGIRTPGELAPTDDFKSSAFDHSATPPKKYNDDLVKPLSVAK